MGRGALGYYLLVLFTLLSPDDFVEAFEVVARLLQSGKNDCLCGLLSPAATSSSARDSATIWETDTLEK